MANLGTIDFDQNVIASDIQHYIDNRSLVERFTVTQICKILTVRPLSTEQASFIFDQCNFRYDAQEIFRIFMSAKVNFGNDYDKVLEFLQTMYLSLKAPIVKAIYEMVEDMVKKISMMEKQLEYKDEKIHDLEELSSSSRNYNSYASNSSMHHPPSPGISPYNSYSSIRLEDPGTSPSILQNSEEESLNTPPKDSKNIDLLKGLQKIGADFQNIYEVLERSAKENDVEAVKYAVKNGYVDVRDGYGSTVIIKASYSNNFHLCKMLHECGADIQRKSRNGNTILYFFAKEGNLEAVQYFVRYIDVNCADRFLLTPLHEACYSNRAAVVEYLVTLPNIQVNLKDMKGRTPLKLSWMEEIRRVLLAHGATE